MGPDERLRRYQEAGADFLETARTRLEGLLRDLGGVGEPGARPPGEGRWGGGPRGVEALLDVIRREVAAQLSALGLATKEDLAELEARLAGAQPRRATRPRAAKGTDEGAPPSRAKPAGAKPAGAKPAGRRAGPAGAATPLPAPSSGGSPGRAGTVGSRPRRSPPGGTGR